MRELIEALSVRKGNITLDSALFLDQKVVLGRCEGLVAYDEMSDEVRFAHFTVFEYLQHHLAENLLPPLELSKVCLQYFIIAATSIGECYRPPIPKRSQRFDHLRFFQFACLHWGLWATEGHTDLGFWELLLRLHETPNLVRTLHWIYRIPAPIFCGFMGSMPRAQV
jgi:hypothetical protein